MIRPELVAEIRRLFEVEGWRPNTIARQLGVHHGTVRRALEREGIEPLRVQRGSAIDPFVGYLRETLERHPDLSASVLWEMVRRRGYPGGMDHFRHRLAELDLRPRRTREAFLDLRTLPGEQAQVDWACIGTREVRGGLRRLLAFVMVLSYSRQLFVRFFHDERLPSLLAGHVFAFEGFGGVPRVILYDNPRTIVLERRGQAIRFQPRLLELADAYGFELRPVPPRRANEKGRVERAIRYLRSSFLPLRGSLSLAELNREILPWCREVAETRPWPQDRRRTVAQAFAEERPRLLRLPPTPFPWPEQLPVPVSSTAQVRFDGNRYSVPPELVGRQVLLVADLERVRLIDGAREIASHPRSFERNQIIEDPAHTASIRQAKRLARLHRGQDRLLHLVPKTEDLLVRLAQRQHRLGTAVDELLDLLHQYGAEALADAIEEALKAGSPHPAAVRMILDRRQRSTRQPIQLALALPDRLRDLVVTPHRLDRYDPEKNK
jgi:transposase